MWVFTVFALFHTISAISFVPCADIPQVGLFTQSVANYSNTVKDANDSAHIILKATILPQRNLRRFPFKNCGLKFRNLKFHVPNSLLHSRFQCRDDSKNGCVADYVPNGTAHSGCTDPTQATARLVIVLVSRIQKSGTGDNNFVKQKGKFRSDRPK